ncbi:MAG: DUF1513 domain-containing protein [Hydrogenophaga sp.]|nr:DUF1513 domain-containing protein [Hydrogenophaga sp.]
MVTRRDLLCLLGAVALPARAAESATLVASWAEADRYHVGQLALDDVGLRVRAHIELPTRAHGLAVEAGGSVLVAARRPGDWLLRWHPANNAMQWHWVDDDRRLNGHVLRAPDGQGVVWTTETDQADARGLIGVRDATTLNKRGEWPTHGMDPHALLVLPERVGDVPAGALLVANGGIPTQSETGRSHRDLSRMDPSLVALDPRDGRLLGQWRLTDPRLSIRHLAFDPASRRVGIALQAEHDDEAARRDAPLLAIWSDRGLEPAPAMTQAMGYGGDICARPGGGFFVSATRAHAVLATDAAGRVVERIALRDAGALAGTGARWWGAGSQAVMVAGQPLAAPATLRLDNHWRWLA